jgi:CheY-like chemotaxis protein
MSKSNVAAHILLVDDEAMIQDLLQGALEDGGFSVVLANDGRSALAILEREAPAISGLVTDINLGAGPTGWDVARQGRRLNAELAVVYMSGGSPHEWEAEGVPGSALVAKPFAPAQVLIALANQITRSGG